MNIFPKNSQALAVALSQIFVSEATGTSNNPKILQYAIDCGFQHYKSDDIGWCSLFLNWVAKEIGSQGTSSLMARSWLAFGVKVTEPAVGDIAVLWRISPAALTGHVGLFLNEVERNGKIYLRILGGNQGDQVKISEFPKEQLLQFRRWV